MQSQRLGEGSRGWALVGVLVAIAGSLQGCVLDIPRHKVGNWQQKESYLKKYGFVMPGGNKSVINSCALEGLAPALQCAGHGRCERWFGLKMTDVRNQRADPLTFCKCDRDWAGPECDIQKKSQRTAFLLSIFLGVLGVDQFYLGWMGLGVAKLATLGGAGIWWLYDIVRIGSTPVVTSDSYRLAADLSQWAFVLMLLVFAGIAGFALSVLSISRHRIKRAQEITLLRAEASSSSYGSMPATQASFRGHQGMLSTPQRANPYATTAYP